MQQIKHLMRNIMAFTLLVSAGFVHADFKSDIIDSCQAYQLGQDKSDINACKLYIDGYIDSSLYMDDATIKPKAQIQSQADTNDYIQRIYRTRTFGRTDINIEMAQHEFCIPTEYDRKYVASQVAKTMDISQLQTSKLKQVLFDTLVTRFPCSSNLASIQAAP